MVLLAGPSGAGKSRLAERLGLPVVRLDDFYRSHDDPALPRFDSGLVDWDDPTDPDGNTAHVAEHGLTPGEVESVLLDPNASHDVSGSTGRPAVFGTTISGRFMIVVYEVLNPEDPLIVRPITAYDVPEPS